MPNPIETGINFDQAQPSVWLAEPEDLIAYVPYLLGGPPSGDAIAITGCRDGLPALCVGRFLEAPEPDYRPDEEVRAILAEFERLGMDQAVVIGYCTRERLVGLVDHGDPANGAVGLSAYVGLHTVLLCAEADTDQYWRRSPGSEPHWELLEIDTEYLMDCQIDAMHAGFHAWTPWGVIDALHSLVDEEDTDSADRPALPATGSVEQDLALLDRLLGSERLPTAEEAVHIAFALLDCRVLARAVRHLAEADEPPVALWTWVSRLAGPGEHYAAGMAGLALLKVCRGPAARLGWELQSATTPDERSMTIYDAVHAHASITNILDRIDQRTWHCERACCA